MPPSSEPPSLRFCCPEALHAKTLQVLETLEQAPDPSKHRGPLGDLVVELTNAGMDDYFLQPLRLAKAGFVVQQTANLGVAGATRIMAPMIRNIIGRLDQSQLLSISGYIRHLMR
ncbi:MAG TPA: hypothetical protein P5284_09690 [Candidatus Contendobacter sp.]|jgi:hypothetical protein|nr:hypothetical protein [Candidatus Contendobacter sp.]HRZ24609.1 hypothetical protein [Candidatus Contendobacter sp.]HRZ53426.1 hypothetical protein [Candidatus Contendobacter sp.]